MLFIFSDALPDDKEFEIIGDVSEIQTQAEIATAQAKVADNKDNGYDHGKYVLYKS